MRARSVCSGFFVTTHPMRLEMRCTWVSTQMPGQAESQVQHKVGRLPPHTREGKAAPPCPMVPCRRAGPPGRARWRAGFSPWCGRSPRGRSGARCALPGRAARACGVGAAASRPSAAFRVTSSFVRREIIVATSTRKGSLFCRATADTDGSAALSAARRAFIAETILAHGMRAALMRYARGAGQPPWQQRPARRQRHHGSARGRGHRQDSGIPSFRGPCARSCRRR